MGARGYLRRASKIFNEASLPSLLWPTGCNQAAGDAARNVKPALATKIAWKVAIQSRHVTRWLEIGAVKLH